MLFPESVSNCRVERKSLWLKLAAAQGMLSGPWTICDDFNITRFISERPASYILSSMMEFSEFIEELELGTHRSSPYWWFIYLVP